MAVREMVTPQIRAMIGKERETRISTDEVCRSEIRRAVLATLDDNPLWYDEEYAEKTKFGPGCAPGPFPMQAVGGDRRAMGKPDPVRKLSADDDYQGEPESGENAVADWPEGVGVFHGSDDVEYRQYARIGDRIYATSKMVKIEEKTGRSGKLAVVYTDTTFTNQRGEILCINHGNSIAREMSGPAFRSRS